MNERKIENIPIDKIIPNIYQPRIRFDENALNELANSIKEHGIIQPLIIRKIGESYEIIDGERRYRAAKKLGLEEIPSIILNINEQEAAEILLTENMQKQKLSPIEEANSYQQIMLLNKITVDQLANKIGKDKNYIENKLKLISLPLEIQEALLNNKISEGHAKLLLKIETKVKQIEMYNKITKERLTVRDLEKILEEEKKEELPEEKEEIKDTINLEELDKKDFLTEKKESKMEENKMDNAQMNFNQYNNLLKEQQTKMMETAKPEPILGAVEPKQNQFFPSLEEQPLNFEVPSTEQTEPLFEMSNQIAQEQPMVNPAPAFTVPEAPAMPGIMEMPQFEMPNQFVEEQPMVNPAPAFTVPEAPVMPGMMEMPQFEMPNQFVEEQPMVNPAPAFTVPEAPAMPGMMEMPQFETPNQFVQEQPTIMTDVMPAVNMIRNLIPLLENSGYKINIEELDNINEYQITLKVQK